MARKKQMYRNTLFGDNRVRLSETGRAVVEDWQSSRGGRGFTFPAGKMKDEKRKLKRRAKRRQDGNRPARR